MFFHFGHGPYGLIIIVVLLAVRILTRRGGGPFGGMRNGRRRPF
jgi:hypothetical protein